METSGAWPLLFGRPISPDDSRAKLPTLRAWRRWLERAMWAFGAIAVACQAGTGAFDSWLATRSYRLFEDEYIFSQTCLVTFFVLFLAVAATDYFEKWHLWMSLADAPARARTPLTIGWRFHRWERAGLVVLVVLAFLAYVSEAWFGHPIILWISLINAALAAGFAYQVAFRRAWRVGLSQAHVAVIDEHGIMVPALDLSVSWEHITGVIVYPTKVRWHLDDPAAIVAASGVRRGRQRVLRRWLKRHGGAIEISRWRMRESPETVWRATRSFQVT
jgi:hypothetical protein